MKSVQQLLTENKVLTGHLLIRVFDGTQFHIQGPPDGFRFFAQLLMAQADGLGNFAQGCTTNLKNGDGTTGFMLSPDSFSFVQLHCHNQFVATQPGKENDFAP